MGDQVKVFQSNKSISQTFVGVIMECHDGVYLKIADTHTHNLQ